MDQHQQAVEAITFFQWVTLGLGVAGFLLTWTAMIISMTRAVGAIKDSTDEKITEETSKITERISKLATQFDEDQRTQDHNFGETALSIRQYVANVEKEMHQIEIWGRDNFVLKSDFLALMKRVEDSLSRLSSEIKTDFTRVHERLDDINANKE